jgi:hypothetical protein
MSNKDALNRLLIELRATSAQIKQQSGNEITKQFLEYAINNLSVAANKCED